MSNDSVFNNKSYSGIWIGCTGTQFDCMSNRAAFILTNEDQSHLQKVNLMGVFFETNKLFFIALEEKTWKWRLSFRISFQTSKTIYKFFHVDGKIVYRFFILFYFI